MKKYTFRATKWVALLAIISSLMFLTGIVLIIVNFSNIGLSIGLTVLSVFMSILFLCCLFAEKSRWLTIGDDEIVLPRGADYNGKMSFKRTVIRIDEITSVESEFYKGDKIITGDCFFYTLKLKDGTKIKFTLYAYGKEAEKEIIEKIKNSIQ